KREPYTVHLAYEDLHPWTDGNGRSGRLLWLWMMVKRDGQMPPLGFLHTFYYSTLVASHD
ncbi:MAG: Fic family protein, partial [Nitrospiraceae bacterium]